MWFAGPMGRSRIVALVVLVAAGALLLVAVAGGGSDTPEATAPPASSGAEPTADSPSTTTTPSTSEPRPMAVPANLGPAPDLIGIDGWLQTEATDLSEIDAEVVILQFWTFTCRNCKNTLPHLQDIYARYRDRGLEIVGVHSPEFGFEKDPEKVQQAALDLGVVWPIALDTSKRSFRSWQGSPAYWPRTYVLDGDGNIRFDHIGEGAYDELEATVAYLLDEASDVSSPG